MARQYQPRPLSSASSEAQLLHHTSEKAAEARQKKDRPGVILVALIVLFLSSAGGISLAVVLMAKVQEIEAACFARDFILFAGILSQLYIGLHIFGARRDYKREGAGPPQMYGQYLHGSAILVARLGIVTWIAALVATAIMIARSIPLAGFAGKVPFLDLLLCVGAIPSFLIISVTIERKEKPFATASISNSSFLTCRVSEFADDLSADSSVSRQSSLQRRQSQRQSQAGSGSVLTLPTAELLGLGVRQQDEKRSGLFTQKKQYHVPPKIDILTPSPAQLKPQRPESASVPEPTLCPGGWRAEWNSVAHEAGVSRSTDSFSNGSTGSNSSTTPLIPASSRLPSSLPSSPKPPQLPTPPAAAAPAHHTSTLTNPAPTTTSSTTPSTTPTTTTNNKILPQQHRYSYTSSSRATTARLSGTPSNLSTVRYASEPEIAVQQSIRVVRNPAYRAPKQRAGSAEFFTSTQTQTQTQAQAQAQAQAQGKDKETEMVQRPDIALLRNAQLAQTQTQTQPQTQTQQPQQSQRREIGTEVKGEVQGGVNGDVKGEMKMDSAVPKRTPSHFSRPMPMPVPKAGEGLQGQGHGHGQQENQVGPEVGKADRAVSGGDVKIPGAYVEDEL